MSNTVLPADTGLPLGPDDTVLGRSLDTFLSGLNRVPDLLGWGEPTHGREEYLVLRNRVFAHLVRQHGFRSIALESDCLAGTIVDDWVTGGPGTVDEVCRTGFSHDFGEFAGNRALVNMMREYNMDKSPEDRLHFHGCDAPTEMYYAPSPADALLTVHDRLVEILGASATPVPRDRIVAQLGDESHWREPAAMMDPNRSIGAGDNAHALRIVADDLATLLWTHAPRIRAVLTPIEADRLDTAARSAIGLLRYHAAMADPGADRLERLCALRDGMMAENLLALVPPRSDRGRCLVFAHNSHLQRIRSGMTMAGRRLRWWSGGALAGSVLADRYAFVAVDGAEPSSEPEPTGFRSALASATDGQTLFPTDALRSALADRPAARAATVSNDPRHTPLSPEIVDDAQAVVFVESEEP